MFRFLTYLIALIHILCSASFGGIVPLTILHTNDVHSHLIPNEDSEGGTAVIAGFIHAVKRGIQNVIVLDAGDMVSGTAVSSLFLGEPIFHVMNTWGIDAACLGNHEFDYGWQRIEDYRRIANFPLLCANAYYTGADGRLHLLGDEPYLVFERGGLKVGVIGVVAEWTPSMTVREGTEGVTFVESVSILRKIVPELSPKVDLLIVLSHVGLKHDRWIANEIDGIDLIVGGHSHTALQVADRVKDTWIVQAGSHARFVGRIDLRADTEKKEIIQFDYALLPVKPDLADPWPETEEAITHWEDQVTEIVDRPLGVARVNLSERQMNFIAEAAYLEATGADYAFQNQGGTRGGIGAGPFTYRTIWNIFPFDNTLVTAKLEGREIPENFHGHDPIDPERIYTIVSNSFVRDQWARDFAALKNLEWQDTGVSLRDAIIRYIEKRKAIEPARLTR